MIQAWQNFLQQANGIFKDELVLQFDSNGLEQQQQVANTKTCLTDLSQYGLLSVSGKDAKTFLQGQLSCDMNRIDEEQGSLASYCSRKGRIDACFRIFQLDEKYFLRLPHALIESVQKELQKYVMFSKVTLENVSNDWIQLGVCGKDSAACIQSQFSTLPKETDHFAQAQDSIVYCIVPAVLYQIFTPSNSAEALWQSLSKDAQPVGWPVWDSLEIQHHLPEVYPDTQEMFLPHPLRFPELNGVSFDKGCYRGQEIIARMEYRGKAKKFTQVFTCQTQTSISAGTPCFDKDEKQIATVIRSAPIAKDKHILLCETPVDLDTTLHIQGQALHPYS